MGLGDVWDAIIGLLEEFTAQSDATGGRWIGVWKGGEGDGCWSAVLARGRGEVTMCPYVCRFQASKRPEREVGPGRR